MRLKGFVVATLAVVLSVGVSFANTFPTKPIRLIVPFAPGGGLGMIAMMAAQGLTKNLGHRVYLDHRPGAGGALALNLAKHEKPDGYTIIFISASQLINPLLTDTGYDLFRDFTPVTQTTYAPYLFAANRTLPAKSIGELVAYGKANPGKLNYGSAGNGTLQHLAMELFLQETGVSAVHIPYKGAGPAIPELMTGQIQIMMSTIMTFLSQVQAKSLSAFAVTGTERSSILPDVPTMIEAGVPGFSLAQWHGVLAPAGTPKPILDFLHQEITKAMRGPEVVGKLASDGTVLVKSSPTLFAAYLKSEQDKWSRVVMQSGMKKK